MVWAVSTDATYVTATSDASDDDLSAVLERMIAAGYTEVVKVGSQTYTITGKNLQLLQGSGNTSTLWIDCDLHLEGQLIQMGSGLKIRAVGLNAAGTFRGYSKISANITNWPFSGDRYTQGIGVFRNPASGSVEFISKNLAIFAGIPQVSSTGNRGFIFGGNNGAINSGDIDGLIISTNALYLTGDYNQIVGIPNVPAKNLVVANAPKVELTGAEPLTNAVFEDVGELKNFADDAFLEGGSLAGVASLKAQNGKVFHITKLTPPGGVITAAVGNPAQSELVGVSDSPIKVRNVLTGKFSGKGSNVSSFAILPPTHDELYIKTLNGSGEFKGGNEKGLTNTNDSERILALVQQTTSVGTNALSNPQIVDIQRAGSWSWVCVEYGKISVSGASDLSGAEDDESLITGVLLADSALTLTQAEAEALTGLTYAPAAVGSVTITVDTETTKHQLYAWCQLQKASVASSGVTLGSVNLPLLWFPAPGTRPWNADTGVLACNLVLNAALTGDRLLVLPGTTTLGDVDLSGLSATFPNGAEVVLTADADLSGCTFQGTVTVSADDEIGPYTLTVGAGAGSAISAGTGISVNEPQATITISGIPDVTSAIVWVYEVETDTTSYPTLTGGSATITVNPSYTYVLRADAPGYLASRFITISGGTPEYEFSLEDYRALYDQGVNRSADILFNPTTLEITITDGLSQYSFADVFRTLEDYLATPQGLQYTAHPYPVVLRDRNIIRFPYDSVQNQVNSAKVMPDPGNATDPELLFEVELEGATDTTYDLFDFSQAGGRILRVRSAIAIAQITVQGDGSFTSSDREVLGRAVDLLEADEAIAPDRYQKLLAGSSTVLIDKDVAKAGGNVSITEHVP